MNARWVLCGILAVGMSAGTLSDAVADMITLQTTRTAVLPPDSTSVNRIAAYFDLASLDSASAAKVEEAVVMWEFTGLATSGLYEFTLFEASVPWTTESIQSGETQLTLETAVDSWLVGPETNEASQGVVARLGLRRVADEWLKGTRANNGLVIATSDVSADTLAAQIGEIKLQVWYSKASQQ